MKKLALLLVLAMAIPAMADIAFTSAWDDVNEELVISYNADPGDGPRGVALMVSMTNGVTAGCADVVSVNSEFNTYMDAAHDIGGTYTLGSGCPLAVVGSAGVLPAADSSFVISMGVLKDPQGPAADGSHELIRLSLNPNGAADTVVSIAADTLRGPASGVVGDAEIPSTMPADLAISFDCYTGPDYTQWVAVGKPDSWCTPRQCYGDANDSEEPIGKGTYWVGFQDINVLLSGFQTPYSGDPDVDTWISADFSHSEEAIGKGTYRVGFQDINILLTYFQNPSVPTDCNP